LEGDAEGDTVRVPLAFSVAEASGEKLISGVGDLAGEPVSKKLVGEAVEEVVPGAVDVGEDVTEEVADGEGREDPLPDGDTVGALVREPRAVTDAEGVEVKVLPAVAEPVEVHSGVFVSVVRMLPVGVPPVAEGVEDAVPEVLAEPVALPLSTPLVVGREVREAFAVSLSVGVLDTVKVSVPEAELVPQGEDVAERDQVLVSVELRDAEGSAVGELEGDATELLVGRDEKDMPEVPEGEPVAVLVGHTDTVDVGDMDADVVGDKDAAPVPVCASTEGEGESRDVGDSEKLPVTVSVTASQPVGLTEAEAEPEALPVTDSLVAAEKECVAVATGEALMDGLGRPLGQAELVADADRVATRTVAEAQREDEVVTVPEGRVVGESERSGERETEGDAVCELEGSGEKENEDVVDAELVADPLGEGEPVDEGDVVLVLRAVGDMGADAVPAAETEVVVDAEPDAVRGPVDVADALSDPRPLKVTGGSRELVVVEEGEKDTTVAEAVAERVEKFEKVAIAEAEPSDETEALAEADSEGEPEAVEVRLRPPVLVTEEEDDTVGELESRPVLVGVEEPDGEPVEDMVFTAEAVGVEELEGKLENVGWPEAVSFEDCEAVDEAERTPLALVVEDAELLSEIVATGVVVADAELDSVPDSEADPVTDRVPLTDPD
jgi:hypothetical protein